MTKTNVGVWPGCVMDNFISEVCDRQKKNKPKQRQVIKAAFKKFITVTCFPLYKQDVPDINDYITRMTWKS